MSEAVTFAAKGPLHGRARVPGDKSISHRALLLAGLAEGTSTVSGLSSGDDVLRTAAALRALGVGFSGGEISGGRSRLHEAERPIDVGNSGTGMRLISGVVASLPFFSVLIGDASIHRRPMQRIVTPLRLMGAEIDARGNGTLAPIAIRGGDLHGIDYTTPVPSAQVKGAVLFAGLGASGETIVRERVASRLHSEELFAMAGSPTVESYEGEAHIVSLTPRPLEPFTFDVPGDPSQAAFLCVAASIVVGSEITVEHVYIGQGRAGFIDVLVRMGASIELIGDGETADLVVRHAGLHATDVSGSEVVGIIDEIPVLAVAAAFAEGTSTFRDAAELRVKESDRIATTAAAIRSLGGSVEELPDGLIVHGGGMGASAAADCAGDHRIAMSIAIAALTSDAPVSIGSYEAVETSWPGFAKTLEGLTCL